MANRGGNAQYDTAEVIKTILQEEDNSDLEDSDVESEEEDHLSEYSNYSDIELLEESCSDEDEVNNCSTRDNGDQSSRERGQGGVVQVNARVADQTQNIYVGKNGIIWQKTTTSNCKTSNPGHYQTGPRYNISGQLHFN